MKLTDRMTKMATASFSGNKLLRNRTDEATALHLWRRRSGPSCLEKPGKV